MTRRLHRCLVCEPKKPGDSGLPIRRGFTRHRDRICSACRREGVRSRAGLITIPLQLSYRGRGA